MMLNPMILLVVATLAGVGNAGKKTPPPPPPVRKGVPIPQRVRKRIPSPPPARKRIPPPPPARKLVPPPVTLPLAAYPWMNLAQPQLARNAARLGQYEINTDLTKHNRTLARNEARLDQHAQIKRDHPELRNVTCGLEDELEKLLARKARRCEAPRCGNANPRWGRARCQKCKNWEGWQKSEHNKHRYVEEPWHTGINKKFPKGAARVYAKYSDRKLFKKQLKRFSYLHSDRVTDSEYQMAEAYRHESQTSMPECQRARPSSVAAANLREAMGQRGGFTNGENWQKFNAEKGSRIYQCKKCNATGSKHSCEGRRVFKGKCPKDGCGGDWRRPQTDDSQSPIGRLVGGAVVPTPPPASRTWSCRACGLDGQESCICELCGLVIPTSAA